MRPILISKSFRWSLNQLRSPLKLRKPKCYRLLITLRFCLGFKLLKNLEIWSPQAVNTSTSLTKSFSASSNPSRQRRSHWVVCLSKKSLTIDFPSITGLNLTLLTWIRKKVSLNINPRNLTSSPKIPRYNRSLVSLSRSATRSRTEWRCSKWWARTSATVRSDTPRILLTTNRSPTYLNSQNSNSHQSRSRFRIYPKINLG